MIYYDGKTRILGLTAAAHVIIPDTNLSKPSYLIFPWTWQRRQGSEKSLHRIEMEASSTIAIQLVELVGALLHRWMKLSFPPISSSTSRQIAPFLQTSMINQNATFGKGITP